MDRRTTCFRQEFSIELLISVGASVKRTASTRVATASIGVALALLFASCGGDGSSDQGYIPEASTTMTVASPAISRAEFVKHMNVTCREAWGRTRENIADYRARQDQDLGRQASFADAVRRSLIPGLVFHIFDSYTVLGAAPGEQRSVERIIGPFQVANELGQMNRWRAFSLAEVPPHFGKYNRRAARYGLDDCLVSAANLRKTDL